MTTTSKQGRLYEVEIARKIGGKLVPASGALISGKGDVTNNHFIVDCKLTRYRTYRFNSDDFKTLQRHSVVYHGGQKIPLMVLGVGGDDYAVLKLDALMSITEGRECLI